MASRIQKRRWRAIAAYAGVGLVAFVALAQFSPPATGNVGMFALAGLVLGAVAAPVFEPKLFRKPWLWQAALGAVGGGVLAVGAGAAAGQVAAAVFSGGVLGALGRYWVTHV